jgi:hypothetical protein
MKTLIKIPIPSFLIALIIALACFGISPKAQAVSPPPDGAYFGANTAEGGGGTLFSLTTGTNNTALGSQALHSVTTGSQNTATGAQALMSNTADRNTAVGFQALVFNRIGQFNTAIGYRALFSNDADFNTANGMQALNSNTAGSENTATGFQALFSNKTGSFNTASGVQALNSNTTGGSNTANGWGALFGNTTGDFNTASGVSALAGNTTGIFNVANGVDALSDNRTGFQNTATGAGALGFNTIGHDNIALGFNAGGNLTIGNNNIDIGNFGANGESGTIRVGTQGTQTATYIAGISGTPVVGDAVVVDSSGQLGTVASAARFKKAIRPMDKASETILALKPVTFQYKSDKTSTPQFGLVAEEVAQANPDLVVRDKNGEIYTVRYDAVNAMLLNEFLKEHKAFVEERHKVEKLEDTVAGLVATVKEQASQIHKVSAQLELSKVAPQTVLNNQ